MSGSHYAPEPGRDERYDCRPLPEREADALAQLRQLVYEQAEAITYLAGRVTHLETSNAAMRQALERQADVLQVLTLRGTP